MNRVELIRERRKHQTDDDVLLNAYLNAEFDGKPLPNDLWYFDPPYHNTFDGYTGKPFTEDDQMRVAARAKYAAKHGAWAIVHNEPTQLIDELFPARDWTRLEAPEKRQINSDVKGRHRVPCWIITNKPELLA